MKYLGRSGFENIIFKSTISCLGQIASLTHKLKTTYYNFPPNIDITDVSKNRAEREKSKTTKKYCVKK